MKHNNSYRYPKSQREIINGKRHYNVIAEKLPSVTTILSATQSPGKTSTRWPRGAERVAFILMVL
jgi:hypothetical protein